MSSVQKKKHPRMRVTCSSDWYTTERVPCQFFIISLHKQEEDKVEERVQVPNMDRMVRSVNYGQLMRMT